MSPTWAARARLRLGPLLIRPLRILLRHLPPIELGFTTLLSSRITCERSALVGYRAVHLTDLHMDRFLPRHEQILHAVAQRQPHWIFITGDLLDSGSGLPHLACFLSRLREVAPVYMTLGNHDHASGLPVDTFAELADRCGAHLLLNRTLILPLECGELAIAGLDDPATGRADPGCIPDREPDRFTLVLAHAPNALDLLSGRHHADLILCGHSHGGQWRIPWFHPFWLPPGCHGRLAGEYRRNGHRLYVNSGVGWSGLPLRINCLPEVLTVDWIAEASTAEPSITRSARRLRVPGCARFDPNPPS